MPFAQVLLERSLGESSGQHVGAADRQRYFAFPELAISRSRGMTSSRSSTPHALTEPHLHPYHLGAALPRRAAADLIVQRGVRESSTR